MKKVYIFLSVLTLSLSLFYILETRGLKKENNIFNSLSLGNPKKENNIKLGDNDKEYNYIARILELPEMGSEYVNKKGDMHYIIDGYYGNGSKIEILKEKDEILVITKKFDITTSVITMDADTYSIKYKEFTRYNITPELEDYVTGEYYIIKPDTDTWIAELPFTNYLINRDSYKVKFSNGEVFETNIYSKESKYTYKNGDIENWLDRLSLNSIHEILKKDGTRETKIYNNGILEGDKR